MTLSELVSKAAKAEQEAYRYAALAARLEYARCALQSEASGRQADYCDKMAQIYASNACKYRFQAAMLEGKEPPSQEV